MSEETPPDPERLLCAHATLVDGLRQYVEKCSAGHWNKADVSWCVRCRWAQELLEKAAAITKEGGSAV